MEMQRQSRGREHFKLATLGSQGRAEFMKTVRDACQLQVNALSIKLSDQIEQLDELINAEGDGAAFFRGGALAGF
jgi:hypothetical protein